ncbi:MAG TPA: NADH-quinone oxidoreductase subunit C [Actinomycetota bacterium]
MAGPRSRLSPAEIVDRLRAQFGQDVLAAEDVHGHASVELAPSRYVEAANLLRDDRAFACDYFDFLTAVDERPKGRGFRVVTHVYSTSHNHHVRMNVACDADEPHCPSLSNVWAGANWHERETAELFGIAFDGHPHLVKLVLSEQFEGHPLRKDFQLMSRVAKPWPGEAEGEGEEDE